MILGLSNTSKNPTLSKTDFCIYCPLLKEWVMNPANEDSYNKFVDICNSKIKKSYYEEDWEYAMSLAIAHYICITDPAYVQAIDADPTIGGVMSSRTIEGISYTYETDKQIGDNMAYKFWQRTGYGNQLINLSNARGWLGVLVVI